MQVLQIYKIYVAILTDCISLQNWIRILNRFSSSRERERNNETKKINRRKKEQYLARNANVN